jgi:hypothetical protein
MLGVLGVVCFEQFPFEISAKYSCSNHSEADLVTAQFKTRMVLDLSNTKTFD